MAAHPSLVSKAPLRPNPADIGKVWSSFVQTRDRCVREQLVCAYMGFARMMAAKVYARRTLGGAEFDDYLQWATIGLIESVDRFAPERGVLFESFAAIRITGAILTGLESSSEIHRQISMRKRLISERVSSLAESAPVLSGPEALFAQLADMAIGLAVGFALEDSGMYQQGEAGYADNTYTGIELKQLQVRVKAALGEISPRQRQVVELHYLQHLQFEEVARMMELTRGRVSQLHKEALQNLRTRLMDKTQVELHC